MQDKQLSIHQDEQVLSLRAQRLFERLESQWLQSQMSSPENLRNILSILPEPYKEMGLNTIAESIVNSMKLHLLAIIAKFNQDAEQEDISLEEKIGTLEDAEADTHELMEINQILSVHSIDYLIELCNITSGIHKLSNVQNADDAQRWMYKLPALYQMKLQKEHLIKKERRLSFTVSISLRNVTNQFADDALKTQVQEIEATNNNLWGKYLAQPNVPAQIVNQ